MCLGLVEERAEHRGSPVPEVAVMLEPVLEQSFDSHSVSSNVRAV